MDDPAIPELLRRARAGDAGAVRELLEGYRDYVALLVRARCAGRLRGRLDSSDIVQETLLRAAQHIGEFQGAGEAEWHAWLGRIAQREVIRQLRHHLGAEKRAVGREEAAAGESDGRSRLERWCDQEQTSPSQAAMRNERARLLAATLARLPEDYREVLVLRHLEGLDFAEVARRLGRSAGAARVLWTRALKALREELAGVDSRGSHV
jgi:RNA polymerase sigma-70 factor (ECF subfamily)